MKVVIVGGVAGGATAATRIRRLDERAEIVIFEKSGYVSYANCGLPYYVGGVIADEAALTVQTPQGFKSRFNIDVRVRHEVVALDVNAKRVTVKNLESGEQFEESYDKLLLAPGAKPTKPNFPGIDLPQVFSLRTVEDTLRIKRFIQEHKSRTAAVIGGGFIGVEVAENLRRLGMQVTIVEYADHLLAPLDADMAAYVHAEMRSQGVKLRLRTAVTGFAQDGDRIVVQTQTGAAVSSDLALLAIGVTPDTALAQKAGLALGVKGSIVVDERLETSAKDVFAVGDAVQVKHLVAGNETLISLAGPANKQGRIAADNICGGDSRYRGSQGSSVLKLFERTVASTGLNETMARRLGLDCESVILSPASHATYYPGAKVMALKVTFERGTWRLLGAQAVGYDGVDKRLDVLATALRAGMKATDLAELELAYAPPYSSAKDPVNMAGFIVENIAQGLVKQFDYDTCAKLPRNGEVFLLDARNPQEYAQGCAEGFVNISLDSIRARPSEIPHDRPVYVMCQSGLRGYLACRILTQLGYDCFNFTGGYSYYKTVHDEAKAACEAHPCGMEK